MAVSDVQKVAASLDAGLVQDPNSLGCLLEHGYDQIDTQWSGKESCERWLSG